MKKLTKKQKDWLFGNIGLGMLMVAFVVIFGIFITKYIVEANKTVYRYGKNEQIYTSKNCYKDENGTLYCAIYEKVDWWVEEKAYQHEMIGASYE